MGNPCNHPQGHEDAARRACENLNMHYQAIGWDAVGKFTAIALADGSSDHVLYDSKRDAVVHQHHNEQWFMFVKILPMAMTECEAQMLIDFHRKAYDAGFRLTDPDHREGGRQVIMRTRPIEKVNHQMAILNIARKRRA